MKYARIGGQLLAMGSAGVRMLPSVPWIEVRLWPSLDVLYPPR